MKKIFVIFTVTFVLFSLFTYLFIDPNFIHLKSFYTGFAYDYRLITSIVYIAFISVFYVLYIKVLNSSNFGKFSLSLRERDGERGKNSLNLAVLLIIPIAGILAYSAVLSFDLFNYIATAKVTFHYFENPYIVMPIELVGDPILMFTRAANKIALYGPVWIGFSSIPFYLSFGNYLLAMVLFKLFVSIFWAGIVWLLWKMTKSVYAVAYFAASPLVLIETFVAGHNDVVMIFFALGSIHLLKNKKVLFSLVFILISILIKYATIFLIPIFIYYFYKRFKKKDVDWDFVYLASFILMLIIFFLSPIREEIYPWYAIWPLTFLSLFAQKKKLIASFFIFFTFCLMLRYIPFMLLGTYFGPTPYIKLVITFVLPGIYLIYLLSKNKFKIKPR